MTAQNHLGSAWCRPRPVVRDLIGATGDSEINYREAE
jgi:hypothetical protein